MSLFSGTRITDKDIDSGIQRTVRAIVRDLWEGRIDPLLANRKLIDLIVKASNRRARLEGREGA